MQFKAIIADDEAELRTYLKSLLKAAWPELVICGEATNGAEAVALVEKLRPNIAFLDIRMPGMSGLEAARRIGDQCRTVFVTAYDQYAVEAFEQEALDYLLKPVTEQRLAKTIARLRAQKPDSSQLLDGKALERIAAAVARQTKPEYLQWIKVGHGDGIRLIAADDVSFFKAEDKYTLVATQKGESLIRKSIKDLSLNLNPERFWQIHRSTIVNVSSIKSTARSITGRYQIRLKNRPEILTVSRSYAYLFQQM